MPRSAEGEYPVLRIGDVVVPDCSKGIYRPFRLGSRERREVIRKLAEKGIQGLDEYLDGKDVEGAVRERMDEIRQRIKEQVERVKASRREALDAEIQRMAAGGGMGGTSSPDGLMDDGFGRIRPEDIRGEILASELIELIESREYEPAPELRPGIFRRLIEAVKRFFRRIVALFMRFVFWVRSLFRKRRKGDMTGEERRRRGAISLPFPMLQGDLEAWEREMGRKLHSDKELQKAVNSRISERYGYSSGLVRMRSSADPEWYRKEAAMVLEDEVMTRAEKAKASLESKRAVAEKRKKQMDRTEEELRDSIYRMERQFDKEAREMDNNVSTMTREQLRKEMISTLSMMGFLAKRDGDDADYEITEALVEKFSELLYAELHGSAYGRRERKGRHVSDLGVYEKDRLRTVHEESRMDLLASVINSRINHPRERGIEPSDMLVLREISTSELHAVILVDTSGSMEENGRLEAAKRSVLALTQAIKRDNPRNIVDIISVSTRARPVTLKEVMSMEPRGFTNLQEGARLAGDLLASSRSDRRLLFLITDGLPEAYTGIGGEPEAGDLDRSMEEALDQIRSIRRAGEFSFITFLLEPKDQVFVAAANRIAKEGSGSLIVVDPTQLASRMLGGYYDSASVLGGV